MGTFGDDYLLSSEEARKLFQHIRDLPIVDAHSHVEAEQIARNRGWSDIWEVEGATDHYVWELMRRRGVPEEKITGSAPAKEKWHALATVFPYLAGNPVYDWIHLDLGRRFGVEIPLNENTWEEIWNETKRKLSSPAFRPQQLLQEMKVEILCTTDSPASDLRWHRELQETFTGVKVLPTWRPDIAMEAGSEAWQSFIQSLGRATDTDIRNLSSFLTALERSHVFFRNQGCVASDHGLTVPWSYQSAEEKVSHLFDKALAGGALSEDERRDFGAYLLYVFAELDAEAGWVMQLHIGAVRDYRESLFSRLGKDSGGDIASHEIELIKPLHRLLNDFDSRLKIVLYGLHPSHTYTMATLARAFPNVFLGAPWWFMDNPYHMREYLATISNVDLLTNFAGMVSDSRKLLSFGSRTEMFRRVLADFLGDLVNQGRMPLEVAADLAEYVAYRHPKELFFGLFRHR